MSPGPAPCQTNFTNQSKEKETEDFSLKNYRKTPLHGHKMDDQQYADIGLHGRLLSTQLVPQKE